MVQYSSKEIEEKVIDVVARALRVKPEDISLDSHLERDLSADSLDALNIAEHLEEEFGIEIPNEVAQDFMTIQAITSGVEQLTGTRQTD